MSWFDWSANDDLPCRFSNGEAARAADLIRGVFSADFITAQGAVRQNHPLLRRWNESPNANAYLLLCSLADDLRLVAGKRNFSSLLHDLKDPQSFEPARHTLRTAGLFERAGSGSIVEFVDARNDRAPDFIAQIDGSHMPVEAKLLLQSEVEAKFNEAAAAVADVVMEALIERGLKDRQLVIVVPDASRVPEPSLVRSMVFDAPADVGLHFWSRDSLHMAIDTLEGQANRDDFVAVHVLAPIHDKDYLRIRSRAGDASKQLRSYGDEYQSGILALGLGAHDPTTVFSLLDRQMRQRRFRGISVVMLTKSHTHLDQPRRTVFDLLEIRDNPSAGTAFVGSMKLLPLDLSAKLTAAEPPWLDQPAYRVAKVAAKQVDASLPCPIYLPDIRRIAPGMLGDVGADEPSPQC